MIRTGAVVVAVLLPLINYWILLRQLVCNVHITVIVVCDVVISPSAINQVSDSIHITFHPGFPVLSSFLVDVDFLSSYDANNSQTAKPA